MREGRDGEWNLAATAKICARELGLRVDDPIFRYVYLSAIFGFLYTAASWFGSGLLGASIAVLAFAYSIVFFTVGFWFLDEQRKRKVLLRDENPNADDAGNPDMRNTVFFVCAQLFLIAPLALLLLNPSYFHFTVDNDHFGIRKLFCAGQSNAWLCSAPCGVFEFPSWFLYTLIGLVRFVPVGDEYHHLVLGISGVQSTPETPALVDGGLKLLFGSFLLSLVVGQVRKVDGRIAEAVEMLKISPELAAGMGPMMIGSLKKVIVDPPSLIVRENAILAVGKIAHHYPYEVTLSEIRNELEGALIELLVGIERWSKTDKKGKALASRAEVLCRVSSDDGIETIRKRIVNTDDRVEARRALVAVAAAALPTERLLPFFKYLSEQNLTGRVKSDVDDVLDDLSSSLVVENN
ncbi:MAG: hypothetical protein ABL973_08790 [Micropepsaceae bacterium]